jgi:hypothetical protein
MKKFEKSTEFYSDVENLIKGGATTLDAIVHWCERRGIEIEAVVPLIEKNRALVANLQSDAQDLNFIKKTSRLPV